MCNVSDYHWRELTVATKDVFFVCFVFCCVFFFSDKHVFVATKHVFVATYFSRYKRLSRQKLLKSYKSFVATKHIFCRDKNKHVLSRQAYFCRDKSRVLMIGDTCGCSRQ